MNNNKIQNQNEGDQYLSMVNYLISQLNKAKVNAFPVKNQSTSLPIFLYEFFVFELYLPSELLKFIKQPILAFRLLDFPSLTLEGSLNLQRQSVIFNQGKSSYFEMDLLDLKDNLLNQPMYIMFLDLNHGNIKVIANCRLNISLFAYDSFLNYGNGPIPEPRRNILQLFDNTMEKVGEFEMSLLIRREYYKFDKNIEIQENVKSVIIKKAKKKKQNLIRDKNQSLMYKGKSPKKQKEIIYDNNKISNSKYTQPQFINNIILEKKDNAFNAHPINKEIIIKPIKEEDEKYPEDFQENKKIQKRKIIKCNVGTETDPLYGDDIPKKHNIKKKEKKKPNSMNNNQKLINSMYNKYHADYSYKFPQYEKVPINNYNNINNNNNFNFQNSNEFNNHYNNQNNINKQNINYEKNNNQINNNNDFEKYENNNYLQFLTDLKSKVNNYSNILQNEQKVFQKLKDERNLNLNQNNVLDNNIQSNPIANNNNNINIDNNNNNNIIQNNKNEEIEEQILEKKSEKKENSFDNKKSEKKENLFDNKNSEKNEDSRSEDNEINNENKNKNKNNIEELNNSKAFQNLEKSNNEIKEEDEYNDFENSGKSKENNNDILDNKFNNFDGDIEIENDKNDKNENDIRENIVENNLENNNNINTNNNIIQSDNDIKEDNSLIEKNKNNNNDEDSKEIDEEIDENIASMRKENRNVNSNDINSGSENKVLASSSTGNIEKLLK